MRPRIVLLVVVVAIGALLFAIWPRSNGAPAAPVDVPTPVAHPDTPRPGPDLAASQASNRTAPVPTNGQAGPGLGKTNDFQFDNKVTGLVKNMLQAPVAGAEVTLSTYGTEGMTFVLDPRPDPMKEPRVRTDSEGRYVFLGMEPRARYQIIVTHPQYALKKEFSMPVTESGVIEQAPIILSPGATLSGYVKDEAGNLINDATLVLQDETLMGYENPGPDVLTTHTNGEGWFSFVNVAPGSRTVGISAPGYGMLQVGGMVFTGEQQYSRDFTLKVAQMICGRVVTGNDGIPNVTVIAIAVSNTQMTGRGTVVTNDKGEFCFEKLAPGDYNVIASAKGWRAQQGRNNRVPTNTNNLVIELMREPSVCGTVIDAAGGQTVANFAVRMRFWNSDQQPTAPVSDDLLQVTNAKGEFCIDGVSPGPEYVVEASAPGYAPSFSSHFMVEAGKPVKDVVVKLNRGGAITGRVTDPDGKPIARARVVTHDNTWTDDLFTETIGISMPTNATKVDVRTDDAGNFKCTGLTAETYLIVVTATGFSDTTRSNLRVGEGLVVPAGDVKLDRGGTLKGTLFDESGKPISGGTVQLRAADGGTVREQSTKTGADGKFVFANRQAGRYLLSGKRAGANAMNPFDELAQSNASQVNVTVAEGDVTTQDLRLQP